MSETKDFDLPEEQPLAIELLPRHWTIVLALLEQFIKDKVAPQLDHFRKEGITEDEIPSELLAVLGGPIIIRGIVVKEMTRAGYIRPEANERVGIDQLMSMAEQYKADKKAGKVPTKKKPKK